MYLTPRAPLHWLKTGGDLLDAEAPPLALYSRLYRGQIDIYDIRNHAWPINNRVGRSTREGQWLFSLAYAASGRAL